MSSSERYGGDSLWHDHPHEHSEQDEEWTTGHRHGLESHTHQHVDSPDWPETGYHHHVTATCPACDTPILRDGDAPEGEVWFYCPICHPREWIHNDTLIGGIP